MRPLFFLLLPVLLITVITGCTEETVTTEGCSQHAVVEDWSELDGCGYLLRLSDGEYLEPVWRWGFCGTPPLPEGGRPFVGFQL